MKRRPTPSDRLRRDRAFVAGGLLLLVALVSTGMLAVSAVFLLHAPGCGDGSGCDEASRSAWARIPFLGWPISVVAVAYFLAVGVGWVVARPPGAVFAWIVRAGAVGSLLYLSVMVRGRYLCPWCLAAHLASFGLLVVTERTRGARTSREKSLRATLVPMAGAFVMASAVLLAAREAVLRHRTRPDLAEIERAGSARALAGQPESVSYPGRHRHGPERAPIRIVVYSDYQCPDCRRVEDAVRRVIESREDVSVSSKHFPMCADCNRHMNGRTLHANACWAARAAETAAMLHGPEGFRRMHRWLFDRRGSFTDREIEDALTGFGWDAREFLARMQTDGTLGPVRADVDEAKALGLFFTPLVFVNGVELKWRSGRALEELVEAVAATGPAARPWDSDPLPLAAAKIVSDWSEGPRRSLEVADGGRLRGPKDAPVQVVVWADLSEEHTGTLHRRLSARIAERAGVRYRFLHYPLNRSCNPVATTTRHEQACVAAQAAESAAAQAGDAGFWGMVDWLVENRGGVNQAALVRAAHELGLEPPRLLRSLDSPEIAETIERQARAGQALDLRFLPMVWIDGRRADRWQIPGGEQDVLAMLLDAAAERANVTSDGGDAMRSR